MNTDWVILIVVGWLIWKKKKLYLIAGYRESEFTGDKNKLARHGGIYVITVGVLILLLAVMDTYFNEKVMTIVGLIVGAIIFLLTIKFIFTKWE